MFVRLALLACAAAATGGSPGLRVGRKGYQRFHANDSLIGRPLPCSYEDKVCFRYNLLFDPVSDYCVEFYTELEDSSCSLRVNRTEFESGSGRAVSACKEYEDPCTGYRMAYDSRCYPKELVRDVICGCESLPSPHFLGGAECRCSAPTPIAVRQPEEEGHCRIPDLRFPDNLRHSFRKDPLDEVRKGRETLSLQCTPIQARCFSRGEVWVSEHQGCFKLLTQGPCPEDHVVALDADALQRGHAETVCVHQRGGCPPGHKRLAFDAQCHENRAIKIASPVFIEQNFLGQFAVSVAYDLSFHTRAMSCVIIFRGGGYGGGGLFSASKPVCAPNNKNQCSLYDVESEPPIPEED